MTTTPPTPDTSWRCSSTNPDHPTFQCCLPAGHHGRDATNNWDLHQDEEGDGWS